MSVIVQHVQNSNQRPIQQKCGKPAAIPDNSTDDNHQQAIVDAKQPPFCRVSPWSDFSHTFLAY
jgi:hypothetical protein